MSQRTDPDSEESFGMLSSGANRRGKRDRDDEKKSVNRRMEELRARFHLTVPGKAAGRDDSNRPEVSVSEALRLREAARAAREKGATIIQTTQSGTRIETAEKLTQMGQPAPLMHIGKSDLQTRPKKSDSLDSIMVLRDEQEFLGSATPLRPASGDGRHLRALFSVDFGRSGSTVFKLQLCIAKKGKVLVGSRSDDSSNGMLVTFVWSPSALVGPTPDKRNSIRISSYTFLHGEELQNAYNEEKSRRGEFSKAGINQDGIPIEQEYGGKLTDFARVSITGKDAQMVANAHEDGLRKAFELSLPKYVVLRKFLENGNQTVDIYFKTSSLWRAGAWEEFNRGMAFFKADIERDRMAADDNPKGRDSSMGLYDYREYD